MKTTRRVVALFVMFVVVCCLVMLPNVIVANATGLEDNLGSQSSSSNGDLFGDLKNQDIGESGDIGDILSGYQTMTTEQFSQASVWAAPVTNIIGYLMGILIVLTCTFVGLITALDLMYIAIPPVRNLLYKAGTDGTGAYTGGMGAGGYGMANYGNRGMGMTGVGGTSGGSMRPTQWVSDEAVSCAAMLGGSQQSMGMNNMGMNNMQQGEKPRVRSVIWVYFKKRAVFLVLLMVAILVLTSSRLMGTGVNLAQWALRIITMFNGKIS